MSLNTVALFVISALRTKTNEEHTTDSIRNVLKWYIVSLNYVIMPDFLPHWG